MRVAILCRPENRSPKILAIDLQVQLEMHGVQSEVIYATEMINRLAPLRKSGLNFHFWLRRKVINYLPDQKVLARLKRFDAIIISECIPNAFWKNLYNISVLKKNLKKPVLLLEVYHIENAPTQIKNLAMDDGLSNIYDGYLYVSPVTEIRKRDPHKGFCIGLQSKEWGLRPQPKEELLALIDFSQPGYEQFREQQINALEKAGIPYLCLEGSYTIEEIRAIYQRATILFIQFPEAFGLPILECLNCGVQIFTPDSSWPMSWRLNEDASVHGKGLLPECFTVYTNENDLYVKLLVFMKDFDSSETPKKVFETFKSHYPDFYYGNSEEIARLIKKLPRE